MRISFFALTSILAMVLGCDPGNDTPCANGTVGAACDTCDVGYQDHNADGTCEPACFASVNSCSDHGVCDDASGLIVCGCDLGYGGDQCEVCAAGYEDNGTGVCEWVGLQDSGFSGTAWTTGAGALTGGGWAEFPSSAVCFGGSVSQSVTVPPYKEIGPLVLRFQARRAAKTAASPHPAVSINGVMRRVNIDLIGSSWVDNSVCLGESAYGGTVEVKFLAFDVLSDCDVDPFHIDNAKFELAGPDECPKPENLIPNGDFSVDGADWVNDAGAGTTTVAGGKLTINGNVCDDLSVAGQAWIPARQSSPPLALQFTMSGGLGRDVIAKLNDHAIGLVNGTGGTATHRVCVPNWARGAAVTLGFFTPSLSGSCSDGPNIALDDLQLIEAPDCPDGGFLFQGGFESLGDSTLLSLWVPKSVQPGKVPNSSVTIIQDPATSFTGNGALRLQTPFLCQNARATQSATVPKPTGAAGPALAYTYRFPTPNMNSPKTEICFDRDCRSLANADIWTSDVICIDPILAGRQLEIGVHLDAGGGTCAVQSTPYQEAWFDDVDLVLAPGCPAQ